MCRATGRGTPRRGSPGHIEPGRLVERFPMSARYKMLPGAAHDHKRPALKVPKMTRGGTDNHQQSAQKIFQVLKHGLFRSRTGIIGFFSSPRAPWIAHPPLSSPAEARQTRDTGLKFEPDAPREGEGEGCSLRCLTHNVGRVRPTALGPEGAEPGRGRSVRTLGAGPRIEGETTRRRPE